MEFEGTTTQKRKEEKHIKNMFFLFRITQRTEWREIPHICKRGKKKKKKSERRFIHFPIFDGTFFLILSFSIIQFTDIYLLCDTSYKYTAKATTTQYEIYHINRVFYSYIYDGILKK